MKVKIRQWNGVASWLWVANDENCGICRMPFNGCCPDCEGILYIFWEVKIYVWEGRCRFCGLTCNKCFMSCTSL
uniref:Anaphase-promoting complex subunit 11 RING-H2 finger domain-containing protein n=1 Tax=Labrus bergylta TaxID=56723 RepID=A0A3Q3EHV3_9LABR